MEALEDAMNLPLCGLFLVSLATMCLIAFSAITVNTQVTHCRIEENMCTACFEVQYRGIYHKEYLYSVQLLLKPSSKTSRIIEVYVFVKVRVVCFL
jgi:hypothetical protein